MEKYRGYMIESTENGFRITLNDGSDKHTHIRSRHFCKKLIDYVVDKKVPTRVSNYVLESCRRLSTDEKYIQKVTIKGMLSEDATTVTVTEKDGDKEVSVKDYLEKFADGYVEITIKNKSEDDLADSDEE